MNGKELDILILEDTPEDAELVQHNLRRAGINFVAQRVGNKADFTAALDKRTPDIIISDYSLPLFNGLEAFLLARDRGISVPFLLVTGAIPEATVIEIVKAGIDDYIIKDNLQRLPNALTNAYTKWLAEQRNEQLNELRKKFVSIMAHQLRTPLTVVSWHLSHLLSGKAGKVTHAQEEILRITHDANKKLIARINDLLTVIEVEEGRTILAKQKVDVESLLASVMVHIQAESRTKDITCVNKPVTSLETIVADPDKIRTVLEKLTENALIYTPEKGTITTSLQQVGSAIRFEVTDTGVGIPQSEQRSIFTPFFRATNASTVLTDASGVGLSIAKHFAEAHGGKVGFSSQEGKGSTFWFEVPLHHEDAALPDQPHPQVAQKHA